MTLDQITTAEFITAVASLGTASYALVDSSKAIMGGVSNHGFRYISSAIAKLYPANTSQKDRSHPLALASVRSTLQGNWLNGMPLADQKSIAKSLVKLRLDAKNAAHLAEATGVDAAILTIVAAKIATAESMSQQEKDVFGRFDLMLSAILDEGYQRADQAYRNCAKAWAAGVAVTLALIGGMVVDNGAFPDSRHFLIALVAGLLAVPLAPISKDLTSALSAGIKTMQLLKK